MTLDDLAHARPHAGALLVPPWTLGCFRRRSITYFNGAEDVTTHVLWLQSHGLTADIRIPARRPDLTGRSSLADCTPEELEQLATADGFIARTAWADGHMSWDTFATFQPYTRWPEPGRLERIGPSLIEWAPSGAYVEDWRLQAGSDGLCVGLCLESETDPRGVEARRDGGLVVAGDHALQVLGRRGPLRPGRASDQVFQNPPAVFDCSILYGRRAQDGVEVELSINPFEVGHVLPLLDGYRSGPEDGVLLQTAPEGADWAERRWRIDTLLPDQTRSMTTVASDEGARWLDREWDVLRPEAPSGSGGQISAP